MPEYHKIQTMWLRDPENNMKTLLAGQWAKPEFEYLANNTWVWTEKIDGTNIRVYWDGAKVIFGGRTNTAQIPAQLVNKLRELFTPEILATALSGPAVLYGEGFGAKIQKGGGNYIPDGCDFILFDVHAGMWLERHNVEDIAGKLNIKAVSIVGEGTLLDAAAMTADGFHSEFGSFMAEGMVMRPATELFNRRGERVISKLKHKDFA